MNPTDARIAIVCPVETPRAVRDRTSKPDAAVRQLAAAVGGEPSPDLWRAIVFLRRCRAEELGWLAKDGLRWLRQEMPRVEVSANGDEPV